ncbi:hypothetical protein [Acinetobacter beijerinckii]|uniref:Transmembrane protein n=1 Tax=Acinetobacter beijerinckii ANC 3835 TaxID=1217649 RepID=N9EDE4_9GAMM|nr:hypothetical protein [Acinetobacter beijerinckii]ENW08443.1 hypothetical protein F934_00030 [Acinetobacter beijerinckii ANC 3835]MBC9230327.1 hypothetical protein [Acinetobacter baumannii]
MIIPKYWAEAKTKTKFEARQYTIKRFGWSDASLEAAQQHAEQRVLEAIEQLKTDQKIRRIDHKVAYNGAGGLPIREEIISQYDDVIITRNSYGALCLNTPDVLFADIDFVTQPQSNSYFIIFFVLLASSGFGAFYFSSWFIFSIGFVLSLLLTSTIAKRIFKFQQKRKGTPEQLALEKIRTFSSNYPTWHLRVYRTPNGYRILVMHQIFEPRGVQVQSFFKTIYADPYYDLMCQNQNCFRARISPKPWRIGVERLRQGIWPIPNERLALRENWVREYQRKAEDYASCRFVEQFGSQMVHPKAKRVQSIHDQYCKSDSHLDIA